MATTIHVVDFKNVALLIGNIFTFFSQKSSAYLCTFTIDMTNNEK